MQKHHLFWGLVAALLLGGTLLFLPADRYARLTLSDPKNGRVILSTIIGEDQKVVYTWTNSIFRIPVREVYVWQNGSFVQREVASGNVQAVAESVASDDVADLYHTGDEFYTNEMNRPFERIVFRVGEFGNPHLDVGSHRIGFKDEVGFGGQVVLEVKPARLYDALLSRLVR